MSKIKLRLITIEEIEDKRLKNSALKVELSQDLDISHDLNQTPEERRMTCLFLNNEKYRDFFLLDPYGIKELDIRRFTPIFVTKNDGRSTMYLQDEEYLAALKDI
jgi:hypothetical protein